MPISPTAIVKTLRGFLTIAAAALAPAQQTTVVSANADNTLYESPIGAFSNGAGESLFVGVTAIGALRRALLRFDVAAALPPGARVIAAELQLQIVFTPAIADTSLFLHRPLLPWGEGPSYAIAGGGGQGAPTAPGDASWTMAIAPTVPWTTPGGDLVSPPSAVLTMPTSGLVRGFVSAAEVQTWLDQPATNHGWLLKTAEATAADRARRIDSRESPVAPPRLVVSWLPRGQAGAWGVGCPVGAGNAATQFVGAPLGGATIGIAHTAMPASGLGAEFFAFELDPLGALLAPACRVHLPLAAPPLPGGLFFLDATGTATTSLFLPPGFPGFLVVAQAAVLDGSALGFALGNAALLVLP